MSWIDLHRKGDAAPVGLGAAGVESSCESRRGQFRCATKRPIRQGVDRLGTSATRLGMVRDGLVRSVAAGCVRNGWLGQVRKGCAGWAR
jgi:hypothetical protein